MEYFSFWYMIIYSTLAG